MLRSAASSMTKYFFRIKQIVRKVNGCFGLCCENRGTPAPLSPMILSYGEGGTSVPLFYAIIQNTDAACSQPVFEKAFISSSNLLLLRQVFPDVERRGDEDDDTDRDILCIGIHTEIL